MVGGVVHNFPPCFDDDDEIGDLNILTKRRKTSL